MYLHRINFWDALRLMTLLIAPELAAGSLSLSRRACLKLLSSFFSQACSRRTTSLLWGIGPCYGLRSPQKCSLGGAIQLCRLLGHLHNVRELT